MKSVGFFNPFILQVINCSFLMNAFTWQTVYQPILCVPGTEILSYLFKNRYKNKLWKCVFQDFI